MNAFNTFVTLHYSMWTYRPSCTSQVLQSVKLPPIFLTNKPRTGHLYLQSLASKRVKF